MILYKYCPFNLRTQRVLLTNEVWYSGRQSLNDPFDCTPQFVLDISEADVVELLTYACVEHASSLSRAQKENLIRDYYYEQTMNTTGVYCLSRDPSDELMWAHYADNHCGITIGWDVEEGAPSTGDDYHMWAQPVHYEGRGTLLASDILAFTRHMNGVIPSGVFMSKETLHAATEIPRASYLDKNPAWGYEKEIRFVTEDGPGLRKFDGVLESITYGCRFDETLKKQVKLVLPITIPEYQIHLDGKSIVRKSLA